MEGLLRDIRYSVRSLRKRPAYSLLVVWVLEPGYFETMKIPIVRGRDITDSDNDHAPGAIIIIDQALQRTFFGAEDPLGAHVLIL